MGVAKGTLVFNTADTADSDNVGAYLRDSGGNLIDSQVIATKRWLDVAASVFDGSGNAIASTAGALNVNVSGGSIDVGTADSSTFTAGTSIENPVGGFYATSYTALTTGKTGAFAMTAYRALSVNINDASGNVLIGSKTSANSIPVVIASDQGAYPVKLQDGSGTALTSTLVGAHQSLDENVTQIVTPLDKTASGSLTALNATVALTTNGCTGGILQLLGTWTGTVVVEGSNDGGTTWVGLNLIAQPFTGSTGTVTSVSANGDYTILGVATWAQIRARMSAFTSGSATTQLNASQGAFAWMATQLDPANLKAQAWLFDGTGNSISSTAGSLNANITNSTLAVTQSGTWTVDIKDSSGNSLNSTSGALNVNISSQTGDNPIMVNDAALANTAIQAQQVTVTTTATNLQASPLSNRKYFLIQNNGNKPLYIGPSGVTTGTGFPIPAGSILDARIGAAVNVFAISSASQAASTLELS